MNTVSITSEIGLLKRVIIHRPDPGLEHITPGKAVEWLYEDIVYLPQMQQEHDLFTHVLKSILGQDGVLDAQDLLTEALTDNTVRHDLVIELCAIEQCGRDVRNHLLTLSPSDLALALLTGIISNPHRAIFPPIPNFIFTRDIAATIGNHIVVSAFAKHARTRETLLTKCILYNHSLFADTPKIEVTKDDGIFLLSEEEQGKVRVTIEGGDVMMWAPRHLFVGCSERTSLLAIEQLRKQVFDANLADTLTFIHTPKERTSMHLDTICTRISETEYVAYAPLISQDGSERDRLCVVHYKRGAIDGKKYSSLEHLINTITPGMTLVKCGNGEFPHDQREQWTDGCNFLALRSGFIVGYDRNTRTAQALEDRGYTIRKIDRHDSSLAFDEVKAMFDADKKVAILLESGELSRARGGPRCMSFPICREN